MSYFKNVTDKEISTQVLMLHGHGKGLNRKEYPSFPPISKYRYLRTQVVWLDITTHQSLIVCMSFKGEYVIILKSRLIKHDVSIQQQHKWQRLCTVFVFCAGHCFKHIHVYHQFIHCSKQSRKTGSFTIIVLQMRKHTQRLSKLAQGLQKKNCNQIQTCSRMFNVSD